MGKEGGHGVGQGFRKKIIQHLFELGSSYSPADIFFIPESIPVQWSTQPSASTCSKDKQCYVKDVFLLYSV